MSLDAEAAGLVVVNSAVAALVGADSAMAPMNLTPQEYLWCLWRTWYL